MEAGSSSNPICLDDSSSDGGDKSEASPPKQADKNQLLGQLHAERLARRRQLHAEPLAGRGSAGTSSGDQSKEARVVIFFSIRLGFGHAWVFFDK